MKKLSGIGLVLLLGVPVWAMGQQPTTANPGGADASPQQGEVQQTPGQQTAQTAQRPVAEVPMIGMSTPNDGGIRLNVVVTGREGVPVAGLKQQEFSVLDNGQPQAITSFQAHSATEHAGPPAETVILLDTVNMNALDVAQSKIAVERYLRLNGGKLAGPTSVFFFAEDGIQGQMQPTTDGNALAGNIEQMATRLRSMGRGGSWGAMEQYNLSLKALGIIAMNEAKRPGRKLLIWVGPGWPLGNGINQLITTKDLEHIFQVITNISRMLREDQITLYSVQQGAQKPFEQEYKQFVKGVRAAKDARPANLNTKVLAEQSGGLVVGPDNDLTRQIETCVRDAEAYYTITIEPARADKRDEYHSIQVQTDKPYLTVRTTTGYYAEP